MLFGVACSCHVQIGMLPDKAHHVACMGEVSGKKLFVAHVSGTVAAKGENMLDMVLLQCLADLEKLFLAAAHTGDMRHGINAEGVLDVGGNLYGFPGTAAACAVGNTDKIGLELPESIQRLEDRVEGTVLFRREDFEGNRFLIIKHILKHDGGSFHSLFLI